MPPSLALSLSTRVPAATPTAGTGAERPDLRQQAISFESVFVNAMLAPVFQSIPTDGPTGGGSAEETWRGLLVERYSESIARHGGLGLADAVYRQLLAAQEGGAA
ncbi:MAG: rod-binding protein [Bauldia sp.]